MVHRSSSGFFRLYTKDNPVYGGCHGSFHYQSRF